MLRILCDSFYLSCLFFLFASYLSFSTWCQLGLNCRLEVKLKAISLFIRSLNVIAHFNVAKINLG
jgi:hypothetical protein